jgi:hypothetical protein
MAPLQEDVVLRLSPEMAAAVRSALDLYARVGRGEMEAIKELAEAGVVRCKGIDGGPVPVEPYHAYLFGRMLDGAKGVLGLGPDGSFPPGYSVHSSIECAERLRNEMRASAAERLHPVLAEAA